MKSVKLWGQKFSEAWLACTVCMVQGDLTVISMKHAIIASKTGSIAGLAVVASFLMCKNPSKWVSIWLTGMFTMFADLIIHPTHFGPHYAEALVTGIGAAALAYVTESFLLKRK